MLDLKFHFTAYTTCMYRYMYKVLFYGFRGIIAQGQQSNKHVSLSILMQLLSAMPEIYIYKKMQISLEVDLKERKNKKRKLLMN